jgi:hypothetical protein
MRSTTRTLLCVALRRWPDASRVVHADPELECYSMLKLPGIVARSDPIAPNDRDQALEAWPSESFRLAGQ